MSLAPPVHSMLQYIAVCCSVLQGVAGCCSVLQCGWRRYGAAVATAAACCSVLQSVAGCCRVLQCVAVCCSVDGGGMALPLRLLQCVAVCCRVLHFEIGRAHV